MLDQMINDLKRIAKLVFTFITSNRLLEIVTFVKYIVRFESILRK